MSSGPAPFAVRAYTRALALLPGHVRDGDGPEMVATFAELWASARGRGRRARVLLVAFGRLPWVAAAEWLDVLGLTRPVAGFHGNEHGGRWRMGLVSNLRFALRTLRKSPSTLR